MRIKKGLLFVPFFLLVNIARSQTSPAGYAARWKMVDSLISKKGLLQTALDEVGKIAALARKEKDQPQLIKALVYRLGLEQENTDDGILASIKELQKDIDSSHQPSTAILQNILAGVYLDYLQRNRGRFYGRTNTHSSAGEDVASWSIGDLNKKISSCYLASLKEERSLARIDLDAYEPIVFAGNARHLRPTLFDLLAHTALDYFKAEESYEGKYSDPTEMDDTAVFSDATAFVDHVFPAADSLSPSYQALLIFQRLIRRHIGDEDPDALLDVDIERLVFAHSLFNGENKQDLYLKALARLTEKYKGMPSADQAWYLQAYEYAGNAAGGSDSAGNIKARAICERVVANNDSSEGWANCRDLLHKILHQELNLQTEDVNIPYQPMRALVGWRNFTRLFIRVIHLDGDTRLLLSTADALDSNNLRRLLRMPIYSSAVQELPDSKDYLEHGVEIALSSMPPGDYMLLGCTDSNWSRRSGVIASRQFTVSNISYICSGADYFVLNRETGRPLAGATVQVWERAAYSGKLSDLKKEETYTTDENGYFFMSPLAKEGYPNRLLEFTIQGDHYFPNDRSFYYWRGSKTDKESYERKQKQLFLFTDRSIYRPGQIVYFKGIVLTKDFDSHHPKLIAGDSGKVTLSNMNGEAVDSALVVTNEYGSYHGMLRLPLGQLNGLFTLSDATGRIWQQISVEEYKRPKFFVEYEKNKGSYRVGDSIRVIGTVNGYAGNVIGRGKVSYTVTRRADFPHPWLLPRTDRIFFPRVTIAHGETNTDDKGQFTVVFRAEPGHQISRGWDPEFEFMISADVTDISGETQSATTAVTAGYTAIRLSLTVPGGDHQPSDSMRTIEINAHNLSGEPVTTSLHVAIYPLKTPQRLIRDRMWPAPDRYAMTEKEWLDSFPNDEYREETVMENWEKGERIWETTTATDAGAHAGQVVVDIPEGKMVPGWYLVEARAADKFGQEVKELGYVELYDGKSGRPAFPQYRWPLVNEFTTQPGQLVSTSVGSSADVYVIRTIQRATENQVHSYSHFTLSGRKLSTEWTVTGADRGGFGVLDAWVRDNRFYTNLSTVNVPWTNKELEVRYTSFREKSEPAAEEKWQIRISGHQTGGVSAEVLTAMYDASLDQLQQQNWEAPGLYQNFEGGSRWRTQNNFRAGQSQYHDFTDFRPKFISKLYDKLLLPREVGNVHQMLIRGKLFRTETVTNSGEMLVHAEVENAPLAMSKYYDAEKGEAAQRLATMGVVPGLKANAGAIEPPENAGRGLPPVIQARKDFRETAFFFPDLRTDSAGNVSFSFTMPEAVTSWKWMTLAHTRDLAFGYGERTVVTQKELMVQPNAPRFLREGDRMELPVKVVNLTDSELTGQMSLELTDPTTGQTADGWFTNRQANQYFTVGARQSAVVSFPLDIPYQYNRPLTYKVVAESGKYSDGEEATLPVVSNRLLVTESLPLNMPGDGTRHFTFDKLLKSGSSETLNHHALTVEFTANPAWYAVQSLPYLMLYPHECSEQVFERVYANALASHIAGASPRLQAVFDRWREADTAQLLSNLQKNQELKTVLLEESPWVMEGKSEAQQKKNLALLFDMHRMSSELGAAVDRLGRMQSPGGGFPWWSGGPDNRHITQYILTGIGHLQRLEAVGRELAGSLDTIVGAALPYLDAQIKKDYDRERAVKTTTGQNQDYDREPKAKTAAGQNRPADELIGPMQVHYLYMRSLFPNRGLPGSAFAAVNYYRKKAQRDWVRCSPYLQGMIALALYRTGDVQTAKDIIASLKQNAIRDEERGMYWKGMEGGYYWWQAPIETQSLLIEAFHEISGDAAVDRDLKTWLLKQKQTHSWPTTTATADACYALLMGSANWLNAERSVDVRLGDKTIDWPAGSGDAGVGYNKKVFDGAFVNPSMGNITVTMVTKGDAGGRGGGAATGGGSLDGVAGSGAGGRGPGAATGGGSPAWGAVYWQYFDMLDKITPPGGSKPALSVTKKLFIRRDTDRGPLLEPLADNGELKPGDRVVARIELRADRDMEYVHMKDMRAACLEPVNVLSAYKWQDGLGYYESTKDASTDFFFDVLPHGTYVFEYDMLAGQSGNFSNGITTIECLYAPEFTYHTEGIRINVEGGN